MQNGGYECGNGRQFVTGCDKRRMVGRFWLEAIGSQSTGDELPRSSAATHRAGSQIRGAAALAVRGHEAVRYPPRRAPTVC